jgi:hypothetical protein
MRYYITIIIFLIAGCTSEISLNQDRYTPKMIVDGWIEPNEPACVFLTFSSPFLTQYDSVSVVKTFLNHAKVTIYSSSGEEEILTLFKKDIFFPPYVYKSTQLRGIIGNSYELKVEYGGKILTASTTIPKPPRIQSISFKKHSVNEGTLIVKYIPNDDILSYYLFQTAQKRSKFKLFPTFYPLQSYNGNKGKIVEIELFNGRTNNIYDTNNNPSHLDSIVEPRYYWIKDTVLVSVSTIDNRSFEVLNSIFFTLSNYDNPFTVSSPALTNINGGIGRWTGLGTSKVVFNIDSKDSLYKH